MILLHLFTPCRYLFLVSILSAPHQTSSSLHYFLHHSLYRYLLTILTNLHLNFSSFSVSKPPVSSTFFYLFVFLAFLPQVEIRPNFSGSHTFSLTATITKRIEPDLRLFSRLFSFCQILCPFFKLHVLYFGPLLPQFFYYPFLFTF